MKCLILIKVRRKFLLKDLGRGLGQAGMKAAFWYFGGTIMDIIFNDRSRSLDFESPPVFSKLQSYVILTFFFAIASY